MLWQLQECLNIKEIAKNCPLGDAVWLILINFSCHTFLQPIGYSFLQYFKNRWTALESSAKVGNPSNSVFSFNYIFGRSWRLLLHHNILIVRVSRKKRNSKILVGWLFRGISTFQFKEKFCSFDFFSSPKKNAVGASIHYVLCIWISQEFLSPVLKVFVLFNDNNYPVDNNSPLLQ